MVYNVPGRTGYNIKPELLLELSKLSNVKAIKEASGNISQVAKMKALCGDSLDFYSGNDDQIVPIVALGGKGVISVLSHVVPQETHDIVAKLMAGDVEGSAKLQLKYLKLIKALFSEVNPIPVKAAMNMMGYNVGSLRMPLSEMEDANKEVLRNAMKEVGIKVVR